MDFEEDITEVFEWPERQEGIGEEESVGEEKESVGEEKESVGEEKKDYALDADDLEIIRQKSGQDSFITEDQEEGEIVNEIVDQGKEDRDLSVTISEKIEEPVDDIKIYQEEIVENSKKSKRKPLKRKIEQLSQDNENQQNDIQDLKAKCQKLENIQRQCGEKDQEIIRLEQLIWEWKTCAQDRKQLYDEKSKEYNNLLTDKDIIMLDLLNEVNEKDLKIKRLETLIEELIRLR